MTWARIKRRWLAPLGLLYFAVVGLYQLMHCHYFAFGGYIIALLGGSLNLYAVHTHQGRMPVYRPEKNYVDSATHFTIPYRYALGDWIPLGPATASIGDTLALLGVVIFCVWKNR